MTEFPTAGDDAVRLGRELFPDLAAELDAALAAARRGGGTAGGTAEESFDVWLDARTAAERASAYGPSAFGAALGDDARARLATAFDAARAVIGAAPGIALDLPEPEAFAAAGADFAALGAALDADPTLEPVPAPAGLGADGWRRLFAGAADAGGGGIRLVAASELEREFARLDRAPGAPAARVAVRSGSRDVAWSLRLVPAGLAPAVLGLSHAHGPHATLPELLMLQLMRVVRGEPPIDARSFTWIAGTLGGDRLAARHVYDAAERTVRLSTREPANQGPHLGARPPIA
ncbi:hypothetical protein MUN78_07615 [Leucobacter allii]|uniref:DUF222 domain-containing protein n=1 Tax=Leucobacter allii TaxID=2932247 RepID=A0ABY4FR72_9MICO|nr:hypothetical protein [Leucobacter allii]UOQ58679.1 hypothetical protein MUN78_07615 [Leucobacter allii]UOR03206.1 hypothetical protein MUN77_07960 [Leucobacter allii]